MKYFNYLLVLLILVGFGCSKTVTTEVTNGAWHVRTVHTIGVIRLANTKCRYNYKIFIKNSGCGLGAKIEAYIYCGPPVKPKVSGTIVRKPIN